MKTTGILLLIGVCFYGIYDLIVFLYGGEQSTISATLKEASLQCPGVLFAIAYICGHVFSPMKSTRCVKCKGAIANE
jgi:hypothetical protein